MDAMQEWLVAAGEAVPETTEQTRVQLRHAVRDLGGVAVAGSRTSTSTDLERYLRTTAAPGTTPVLGRAVRLDPVSAALANATAAQALDFDDIAPSCVAHLGAIMVPAMLGVVGEAGPERAFEGLLLGLSVVDRLAEAFTHEVYDRGIQPTHTVGSIGATVAMCRALGLAPEVRADALGLVATQLLGLRSHTGTRYKPVQAGVVSAAAVRSVLLAQTGITAGADALDVVLRLIGIDDRDLRHLTRDAPIGPVPIALKAYPTCGAAHTAIEATLDARRAIGVEGPGAPLPRIRVTCPPRVMGALEFERPSTPDQARFSMQYAIATAWVMGRVEPTDFTEEAILRPEVLDVMDRVEVDVDDALTPPPTWSGFPAIVEVEAGDAAEHARVDRPLGYPERPMSGAELWAKFGVCTRGILDHERASTVFAALDHPDVLAGLGHHLSGIELD